MLLKRIVEEKKVIKKISRDETYEEALIRIRRDVMRMIPISGLDCSAIQRNGKCGSCENGCPLGDAERELGKNCLPTAIEALLDRAIERCHKLKV